jgi:hypothetical protein
MINIKKVDEYQCLMSKCIDKAIVDMADEQDPAVTKGVD